MDMVNPGKSKVVRRGRLNLEAQTVTIGSGPATQRYAVAELAEPVKRYLMVVGLKTALLESKDADGAYRALRTGLIPDQRPEPIARSSKSREALAHALAHAAAVAECPRGTKKAEIERVFETKLPAMVAHVATLSRQAVVTLAKRADVQERWRVLFGKPEDHHQSSLLAIAGVEQPSLAHAAEVAA